MKRMKTFLNFASAGVAVLGLFPAINRVAFAQPAEKDTATIASGAEDTARDARELCKTTPTSLEQGKSKADMDITIQIRKEIMEAKKMSLSARNVKIITIEGRVTLLGLVNSATERRLIGEIVERIVLSKNVDNELKVKSASLSEP